MYREADGGIRNQFSIQPTYRSATRTDVALEPTTSHNRITTKNKRVRPLVDLKKVAVAVTLDKLNVNRNK